MAFLFAFVYKIYSHHRLICDAEQKQLFDLQLNIQTHILSIYVNFNKNTLN